MALTAPIVDADKTAERVRARIESGGRDPRDIGFRWLVFGTLLFSLLVLSVLIYDVVGDSWSILSERFMDFLARPSRSRPDEAGVFTGLRGTFWIGVFVIVLSFPIGIGAAIYLEEYASGGWFSRLIDVNIRNLAGVPSVVYGILGFTIFVGFFNQRFSDANAFGKVTAAGGLTLAVLSLPIVIITSAEAIRAVPESLREAGYGVGATKWEVVRNHVLPYAAPGILTGTLLSLARALGEAAPLILVGAIRGKLGSDAGFFDLRQLGEQFTAMPIMITEYASKPGEDWVPVTAAAIVILLLVVLGFNAAAVLLRNRFESKREGK